MSDAVIAPKVHRNGTSRKQLIEQISQANIALNEAVEAMAKMSPNARDYYLTDNYSAARYAHVLRVEALKKVQDEIIAIGEIIADQEDGDA